MAAMIAYHAVPVNQLARYSYSGKFLPNAGMHRAK
jgi:hypothetical protein